MKSRIRNDASPRNKQQELIDEITGRVDELVNTYSLESFLGALVAGFAARDERQSQARGLRPPRC